METHLKEIQRLAFELMAVVTSACEMADRKADYDVTVENPAPVEPEAELTEKEQDEAEELRAERLRAGVS